MKYFKHKCDAMDGEFIGELFDRWGHEGYVIWFGLLEVLGIEFEAILSSFRAGRRSDVRPIVSKGLPFWSKRFRSRPKAILAVFRFAHKRGRIASLNYRKKSGTIELFVPKFLDAIDEYTRKAITEACVALRISPDKVRSDSGQESGATPPPFPSPPLTPLPPNVTADNRRDQAGGSSDSSIPRRARKGRPNNGDLILEHAREADRLEAQDREPGSGGEVDAPDRVPVPDQP